MASSQLRPIATASICSSETESGTHKFELSGYSHYSDGLGDGKYICSGRFTVGGHDWRIRYYPDGTGNGEDCKDYVGVQLELMGEFSKVRLAYEFRLTEDQADFKATTVLTAETSSTCGTDKFKKKSDLSRFLWNDSLVIHCVVTVIKEAQLRETAVDSYPVVDVRVPPSNLSSDLGQLLLSGKDADITFRVKSEVFRAHKLILDMRCAALKTAAAQPQIDGQTMRDRRTTTDNSSSTVVVEDMEPAVFKALLHFIYTDSLTNEHKNEEMANNLLAAADKYAMERMKLYCGRILSKRLTVNSVTTTIALAHKHRCKELKDACIQFINSSPRTMADVFSSEGYEELERACPAVVLEIMRKSERKKYSRRQSQGNKSLRSDRRQIITVVKCQERTIQQEKAGVPHQCFTCSRHVFRSFARLGQGVSRPRKYSRNVVVSSSDEE